MASLSDYMAKAGNTPLPADVIERSKLAVLDTMGAMVSGSQLKPGLVALAFASANPGERICTIAASKLSCGPIEAALANGMLAHADETDDSHPRSASHPGCSVVSAALAAGQRFAINGERFLRAVVLGYDIGPRVNMTLGRSRQGRSHSIAGTFGSAAAAGAAAGLSAQQMRWLLSYAAQSASGISAWQRDTDHIEKSLVFGGLPARNGVSAALVVHAGGTGVSDVFSGPGNFFDFFRAEHDPSIMAEGLGQSYEVLRTDIKKWSVGSPMQAPLDAIVNIRARTPIDVEKIAQVTVRVATSEAGVADDGNMTDVSLQHIVAVMLFDKGLSFHSSHDAERVRDTRVRALRSKVKLIADEELEKLKPKRAAIVQIDYTDGQQFLERVETVRGTSFNPMSKKEVVEKARDLITPVLGSKQFEGLVRRIFDLEKMKNVIELQKHLALDH